MVLRQFFWLLFPFRYCLSLYAKSPSAYRLVQQIMVLPSARTLRAEKMQTLNRCQTGLQNGAATRIRQCVDASENFHEQLAVISIDEMTIKGVDRSFQNDL